VAHTMNTILTMTVGLVGARGGALM
jgi:hypothetical protein